jgi:hypothetical protein
VNPAGKVSSIVAGMAAGADSIEDLDVLRHGGMPELFGEVYAPRRVDDVHRVGDQMMQAGVLGQAHHPDQARTRHEVLLVEPARCPPPRLR